MHTETLNFLFRTCLTINFSNFSFFLIQILENFILFLYLVSWFINSENKISNLEKKLSVRLNFNSDKTKCKLISINKQTSLIWLNLFTQFNFRAEPGMSKAEAKAAADKAAQAAAHAAYVIYHLINNVYRFISISYLFKYFQFQQTIPTDPGTS